MLLTTGAGSLTTGSSAGLASASGAAAVSVAGSVGFSATFSALGEFLPLMVARNLANGDFGFSPSSSLVAFSFLLNQGRELLRLSALTAGVSVLVSPLATGAAVVSVSTGAVAGLTTLVANGSVDSTAGITGAVSLTGSASLEGTAGAASSFFSGFWCENCDLRVPKMLLRLVGTGFASTGAVGSSTA